MKTLKLLLILVLTISFSFVSCRTEEDLSIDPPIKESIKTNPTVANLLKRTATKDGSNDNIIDQANCLTVQLPVTVTVNGIELEINNEDEFEDIEEIFDLFDEDVDAIIITYPITVILSDFSTVVVNSDSELTSLAANCNDENENDDDIECIDFQYPITASIFNENNDLISTISINNDKEMYNFIDDLDDYAAVTINFPITVLFADDTTQTINNIQELGQVIEMADDSCDEDDDFDFDDDDCNSCSTDQLSSLFSECSEWIVNKLERNDNDLEDNYVGYVFSFNNDGSISVTQNTSTFNGTWEANGSNSNITFTINVNGLSDFNATWNLHEIENESGETKVDFRLSDDRLRFESKCTNNTINDNDLVNSITTGDWYITYFFDDKDETSDFQNFVFNFASDKTITATNANGTTNGYWSTTSGDETNLGLNINLGTSSPLDELADDWDVLEVTNEIIRLKDVSGGDGSEEFLTFEREPFDSNNNQTDNLSTILTDGLWFVASYTENNENKTSDFENYELNFKTDGSVTASNNSNTNNGTWSVLSGGSQLALDFGTQEPFEEFNDDDWDVISVSNSEVILQDVSGGNGEIDKIILRKK